MQYAIAVFKSRNETLFFANFLRNNGIMTAVVNTPKEAGGACGISVKFPLDSLSAVKGALARRGSTSFVGFLKVTDMGVRKVYEKI